MRRRDTLYPIEMTDMYVDDASDMTAENVLRWLFEFGSGYVRCTELDGTWADAELTWRDEVDKVYLKSPRVPGFLPCYAVGECRDSLVPLVFDCRFRNGH